MISCRRPSNKSSRLTLPLGPSNSYFFSTSIHGIRRRSAASASRERVKAFSFTRSCCRAASHSSSDTTGGVFIAICTFCCSLSLSLLVAISFLLCFLKQTETTRSENFSELANAHRQNSSRGSGSGDHYCCACDACWAHRSLLRTSTSSAPDLGVSGVFWLGLPGEVAAEQVEDLRPAAGVLDDGVGAGE